MKKLFVVLAVLALILFGFFANFVTKVEPEKKTVQVDIPLGENLKAQNAAPQAPVLDKTPEESTPTAE